MDDPVWHSTTFTKNRDRLRSGDVAAAFFDAVQAHARAAGLLSDEHFTVDGTQLEAWASLKSFRCVDAAESDPPEDPGNPTVNFHGERRRNDTHQSTIDHWYRLAAAQGHQQAQRMIDALTVRPLPGPFDPYEPSTDDAVLIQRASERAAAAYSAAHQAARHADTTLDRAAQILGRIVAAANVLDRHEQNRSAAYSRLYQTITNLDRTAERTNHRLQAIIKALKQRDKETIAIEARLRQIMIDRIGDPQGVPADDEPANGTR